MIKLRTRIDKKISLKAYLAIAFVCALFGQYLLEDKGVAKFLTAYLFTIFVSVLYARRPSYLWGGLQNESAKDYSERKRLVRRKVSKEDMTEEDIESSAANLLETTNKKDSEPVRKRMHYLDNLKVFLTFLVVLNHTADAFGCCGNLSWMMVIGDYDNPFKFAIRKLMIFNQSYFMCLFFFISGYFTASSYKRKGGHAFIQGRITRLLVPAWVSLVFLNPLCFCIAQWTANSDLVYFPSLGATWFIYWLLFFEWIYILLVKDKEDTSGSTSSVPFLSTRKRWMWGLGLCGFAQFVVSRVLNISYFYAMPIASPGTLFSDIVLFTAGTVAGEYGWISHERTITEQMDIAPWKLRVMVCLEGVVVMYLHFIRESPVEHLAYFLAAGMLCVDISVAYLQFFQEYVNQDWSYLAGGAYTVYLLHPLVIQICTSVFYKVYDVLYPETIKFAPVVFGIFFPSSSHLSGPGDGTVHLWIGFFVVLSVSNAILWPLSYHLSKLPVLNRYL
jgi:fucose 4-O-acetylase-like acetyltransferase